MCGRGKAASAEDVRQMASEVSGNGDTPWPDAEVYRAYPNAYPGKRLGVVIKETESFAVRSSYWGLVPSVEKAKPKDAFNLFNARVETAHVKSSFKNAFAAKYGGRGVAILDGFYEWITENKTKQPHFVHRADGRPLLLAALCRSCKDSDDTSCTLLTRDVVPSLAWLHDRMPLILPDADAARHWIESARFQDQDPPTLKTHMVSTAMNKLAYQEEDAATPIKPNVKLTAFFSPRSQSAASSSRIESSNPGTIKRDVNCTLSSSSPSPSSFCSNEARQSVKEESPQSPPASKKRKTLSSPTAILKQSSSPRITDFFKKK